MGRQKNLGRKEGFRRKDKAFDFQVMIEKELDFGGVCVPFYIQLKVGPRFRKLISLYSIFFYLIRLIHSVFIDE